MIDFPENSLKKIINTEKLNSHQALTRNNVNEKKCLQWTFHQLISSRVKMPQFKGSSVLQTRGWCIGGKNPIQLSLTTNSNSSSNHKNVSLKFFYYQTISGYVSWHIFLENQNNPISNRSMLIYKLSIPLPTTCIKISHKTN